MKIMLLGKNGLLGSQIQKELDFLRNINIYAFDKDSLDITDTQRLKQGIDEINPDFIINAAAYTNVDNAEDEKETAFKINAYAVSELSKITSQKSIPLMHFSTDYVFDGKKENGYSENDKPNPINAYGESKALGEKLLMQNTHVYFLIRSSALYGKNGSNFVDTILNLAKTKHKIEVVNDIFTKPTYANDLAKTVLNFLNSNAYGIYHIVNEGISSFYDFAKEILIQSKIKADLIPISQLDSKRKALRPKYSILNNTRLPNLRHYKEALKEYLTSL